jgi:hypothetical protein
MNDGANHSNKRCLNRPGLINFDDSLTNCEIRQVGCHFANCHICLAVTDGANTAVD